jgi:hypothetical protein
MAIAKTLLDDASSSRNSLVLPYEKG